MILKGKKIYLSGPIEFGEEDWRPEPKKRLKSDFGIDVFDPYEESKRLWHERIVRAKANLDFRDLSEVSKSIVSRDLGMVHRSDALIACLPYMVPTIGTHHEIIESMNTGKPTMIVCPEGKNKIPIWHFGFVPLECIFGSWDELYTYLFEVDANRAGDGRWDFIRGGDQVRA